MQRDMDLIRTILLEMASHEHGFVSNWSGPEGYGREQLGYHFYLLDQAGLIRGHDITTTSDASPNCLPLCLTWSGHDFIDAARSPGIWRAAMDRTFSAGLSVSMAVFKQLLESLIRAQLGL